jgi:polyisoprenoid-binding protein YceI
VTRYRIVPDRSHVWIDARSNVHPIRSSTDGLEGFVELELDGDGHLDPGVTTAAHLSLDVRLLQSGNRMEDRELQKRIDARKYPTIEGTLSSMTSTGQDGSYAVGGDILFRGVSRRYDGTMTVKPVDERTISLAGQSRFDIRDFGMEAPRVLVLRVEPEVDIRVEIFAEKDG